MKVLSVSKHSPASLIRVGGQCGLKMEDITSRYPVALTVSEAVVYVHVGGVTIALPHDEFARQAAQFDINEFPNQERPYGAT